MAKTPSSKAKSILGTQNAKIMRRGSGSFREKRRIPTPWYPTALHLTVGFRKGRAGP
jgi:hypothetical protein